MRSTIFLPLLAAAGFVAAQSQSINPDSVDTSTRDEWCNDQTSACPILCSQTTQTTDTQQNSCDASTLSWSCVCNDGTTPNSTQYSMPIPFHECQQFVVQCVANCGNNNDCATNCRTQNPCGAQAPTRINTTTSSTSSPTSAATTGSGTFGGKNGAGSAFRLGEVYGLGLVAAGLFAGFALIA